MLQDDKDYCKRVLDNVLDLSKKDLLPKNHVNMLYQMRDTYNFNPKVIYDIGSCVLHWTNVSKKVWPNSKIYLFDAFTPATILYKDYDHFIGVLSDQDDKQVKFYQNDFSIGGNSYYREIGCEGGKFFPVENYLVKNTKSLDSVVRENNWKYPDLIKIDTQGSELDILKGAQKCLEKCEYLIVELQFMQYNDGAPLCNVTIKYLDSIGFECIKPLFSNNAYDGDYLFKKKINYI